MSEIFSRLKKQTEPRLASLIQMAPPPEVEPLTIMETSPSAEEIRGEISLAVAPPPLPKSEVHFDLAAADRRIQSVLDPLTIVGEQYRMLRAKLSLLQKQKGIKTLLVTSCLPGEGKTFTACCLAGVFAQEPGRKVLLIDSDLRKPRAETTLGVSHNDDEPQGFSQVLRGEKNAEDVLLTSAKMDFYLLPAGPIPDDPAELLSSPNLEKTLKRMAGMFDWVVIDSPPIVGLADSSLLVNLCDAVLLIVRQGKTPSKVAKDAVQRLGREKICGVVMNRSRNARSNKYYYQYYRKN
jgi:capsular exopolysaccharide synthesis family protein